MDEGVIFCIPLCGTSISQVPPVLPHLSGPQVPPGPKVPKLPVKEISVLLDMLSMKGEPVSLVRVLTAA